MSKSMDWFLYDNGLHLERVNGDLFNAFLLYWRFCLHSNITYDNLWIFRVAKKNKKNAHIVGNNNTKIFLLASWHCCYRFEASISWQVAVFFAFWCYHLWSLIYSFQSLAYIQLLEVVIRSCTFYLSISSAWYIVLVFL